MRDLRTQVQQKPRPHHAPGCRLESEQAARRFKGELCRKGGATSVAEPQEHTQRTRLSELTIYLETFSFEDEVKVDLEVN